MGRLTERPLVSLEVLRVDPRGHALPQPVPGTFGATGVVWESATSLLVTVGRPPVPGATTLSPGVYRISLSGSRSLRLAVETGAETPVAPLVLSPEAFAYVRERPTTDSSDGVICTLVIQEAGQPTRTLPLRRSVHQLLRFDPARRTVLLYSRWQGDPALLQIGLRNGAETDLGRDGVLLGEALRAPNGPAAIAFEDADKTNGWELVLLDSSSAVPRPLRVGPGDDLMPAWRPDGGELAFLAQAAPARSLPQRPARRDLPLPAARPSRRPPAP